MENFNQNGNNLESVLEVLGVPDLLTSTPSGSHLQVIQWLLRELNTFIDYGSSYPSLSSLSNRLKSELLRWLDSTFQEGVVNNVLGSNKWDEKFSSRNLEFVKALLAEYVYCYRLTKAASKIPSIAEESVDDVGKAFEEEDWRHICTARFVLETMGELRDRPPANEKESGEQRGQNQRKKKKQEVDENEMVRSLRATTQGLPRGQVGYSCRDLKEAVRDGLDDFLYDWLNVQNVGGKACETYGSGHDVFDSSSPCYQLPDPKCGKCDRVLGGHQESILMFQLQYLMCGEIDADRDPMWDCGLTQRAATSYFLNITKAYRETRGTFFRKERKKAFQYLSQLIQSNPETAPQLHAAQAMQRATASQDTLLLCMFTCIANSLKKRTPSLYYSAQEEYVPFLQFYLSSQLA